MNATMNTEKTKYGFKANFSLLDLFSLVQNMSTFRTLKSIEINKKIYGDA